MSLSDDGTAMDGPDIFRKIAQKARYDGSGFVDDVRSGQVVDVYNDYPDIEA